MSPSLHRMYKIGMLWDVRGVEGRDGAGIGILEYKNMISYEAPMIFATLSPDYSLRYARSRCISHILPPCWPLDPWQ